jgi:hypothetical protein
MESKFTETPAKKEVIGRKINDSVSSLKTRK